MINMASKTTFEDELYKTNVIIGKGIILIQKTDKMTERTKQMLFDYQEWDKITEIINKNKEEKS